jgi:hypothetical protein
MFFPGGGHEKTREGNRIALDETGRIMNEKMMPELTAMVPELEIAKTKST